MSGFQRDDLHIGLGNFKWYLLRQNELPHDIGYMFLQIQHCSVLTMGRFERLNYKLAGVVSPILNIQINQKKKKNMFKFAY